MKTNSRMTLTQTQRLSLNTGIAASLGVLHADAAGLTRFLEEQAAQNPQLMLTPFEPPPADWIPRWSRAFASQGADAGFVASAGPSLMAHVSAAIEMRFGHATERHIALHFADALEPSGWLGKSLEVVAHDANCSLAAAQAVLTRLQQIEPVGLFARSLAECLRLQADETGIVDQTLSCMIDHLDLVAAGETARLARMCAVSEADILQRLRTIRSFDPKPGAQFSMGEAALREPDLIVTRHPEGWRAALNRSALPDVSLSDPQQKGAHLTAARNVQRMVTARNSTLLRVGTAILQRQAQALDTGLGALVPMSLADVAKDTGLHQSTISRVIAGAAVDTPLGTWWLRRLFSADRGAGISAAALRARLLQVISAENAARPLSDDALAVALSDGGAQIARRTIAKYRTILNIPPAHRRRKGRI